MAVLDWQTVLSAIRNMTNKRADEEDITHSEMLIAIFEIQSRTRNFKIIELNLAYDKDT